MTDKTVAEQYFEKFAAAHRTIFELEVTNSTLKSQCAELEKATAALQSRLDEAVLARDQQTTQARTLVDQLQVKESRVAELKRRLEAALVFRAGFDDGDEDSSQPSIKPESPAPKQYPKDDVKAAATEAVMASGVANVDRGRSLSSNSADPLTVDDRAEATGLIAIPDFGSLGRTGSNEKSNRVTFGSAKQGRKRGRISCTQEE